MMNSENRFINGKMRKDNPFQVPEGYFETFASKMMDSLPEREAVSMTLHPHSRSFVLRRVLYAAACLCVAIFGVAVYWIGSSSVNNQNHVAQRNASVVTDTYIEQVADYTMMDNSDIYSYLSSNDQ